MRQMVYSVSMTKKRYFHEVIEEDQKILDIGLKQSRLHKKERTKEKSLHDLLMEGFREEQRQRELEEEEDD